MKSLLLTLFLTFVLWGCKKDRGYQDSGTVIGMDYRKCMCCGGWFIEIDKDTLRFDVLPEEFTISFDSIGYPVQVYLDWHHKDPKCLGDEIIVDRIEVR